MLSAPNPSANPSAKGSGNPYSERRPTTAPTPSPAPLTSSRSVALGRDPELNEWSALARVITALRPDWRWADVRAALLADDRAYAAIARSAILGAGDDDVRHPNGLRYVNPRGDGPSEAERHPSAITYAERMAELAALTEADA